MVIQSKLYGNATVWQNLVNDSLTNHLAHAYIFAGMQGIGKASMAKEYIKYLLKANDALAERIDEGSFLDLLYITKQDKNEIGIDIIRSAGDFFQQTPTEGTIKFVIIDSADDLNLNSANALLKILEEPTKSTYLFLISHSPYRLLKTIRSRCRIIKFAPLSPAELKLVANMGKFSTMEDFIAGSASKAIACQELDVIKLYAQLIDLIQSNDILAFNKFTDSFTKNQQQWQLITELLLYLINRCVKFASHCLDEEKLDDIERDILPKLTKQKPIETWFEIYDELILNLKQNEIYNSDKKQLLLLTMNAINS